MASQPYGVARFRRAIIQFVAGRITQGVGRGLLVLALVRLLSVTDYGAYMLLVGLAEMMTQVCSFGILPVGQRYLPQMIITLSAAKLYRFVSALIFLQMGILCIVTMGLWRFWPVVTTWMGISAAQAVAAKPALWLFFFVPAFRFISDMQESLLEQGKAQIARSLMPIGRLAVIGVLVVMGMTINLPNIIILDVWVTAFCLVLSWILLHQSLESLRNPDADGQIPVRDMLRFAWHMAAVDLNGSTSSRGAIRLALANAIGIYETGLFAFLQSLRRLVDRYMPGVLLRGIIRPLMLARAYSPGGMAVVEAGTGFLMKLNLLIITAGSVVIAVGGDALVMQLSGNKFPNAGFTLLLMFMALAVSSQRSIIDMVMQVTGHTSTLRATSMLAPVALLAVWLFADHGLNVAVLIIACGGAISNWIAMSVLIRSTGGFRFDWRGLMATVVPAALVIGAGVLLRMIVHPITAIAIALVLFALLLWLAKPFNNRELGVVERAVGQRITALIRVFSYAETK